MSLVWGIFPTSDFRLADSYGVSPATPLTVGRIKPLLVRKVFGSTAVHSRAQHRVLWLSRILLLHMWQYIQSGGSSLTCFRSGQLKIKAAGCWGVVSLPSMLTAWVWSAALRKQTNKRADKNESKTNNQNKVVEHVCPSYMEVCCCGRLATWHWTQPGPYKRI